MCIFPNIMYVDDFVPLNNLPTLPASPKAMFTLLVNKGIVPANYLVNMGVANMNQLEEKIFKKVKDFQWTDEELFDIFCLIHIWGGISGRNIFLRHIDHGRFNWSAIVGYYRNMVNMCLATSKPDTNTTGIDAALNSVPEIYKAINDFHGKVKWIGAAFLTKHTRFWLTKNNPQNPLPIYDKTFSVNVMGISPNYPAQIPDIIPYWHCMIDKARMENVSLLSLERQLFAYFN